MSSNSLSPEFEAFQKEVEYQALRLALNMDGGTFNGQRMQIWIQSIGNPIQAFNIANETEAQFQAADFVAVGGTAHNHRLGLTWFYIMCQGENKPREGFYFKMRDDGRQGHAPFYAAGPWPLITDTDHLLQVNEMANKRLDAVLAKVARKEVADGVH